VARAMTRQQVMVSAGVGGVTVATIGGTLGALALTEAEAPGELVVRAIRGDASAAADPTADAWGAARRTRVPILPQQLVPPALESAGIVDLEVEALHDDETVAFRLTWDDASLDDLDGVRRYHDAVAVMLPTAPGDPPAITMGARGVPVHILQWRATWQRDLDGKTGVDQIYPRVIHDVMPDDVLPAGVAAEYWVARKAGNPLSQAKRTSPIEQVVAEGFGTTTHVPGGDARGAGVHDGERWRVAIAFPRARPGFGDPLAPDGRWHASFAVWLGERENRGGRKHYADWVPLRLA